MLKTLRYTVVVCNKKMGRPNDFVCLISGTVDAENSLFTELGKCRTCGSSQTTYVLFVPGHCKFLGTQLSYSNKKMGCPNDFAKSRP